MTDALRRIGAQLANVAFNWSQRPGHALTSDDVAMLDKLRRAWDEAARAALAAPPAAPPVPAEWSIYKGSDGRLVVSSPLNGQGSIPVWPARSGGSHAERMLYALAADLVAQPVPATGAQPQK